MHKSKIKQISLAVCLAFVPLISYAAGLGKLSVNSGLGEPLKAEVELLSVTPEELSTLTATIASEDAYSVQGITRLGIHNNIKVELTKNADGSPLLRIRSTQPVNDPYLDMLIQVDWASGRLLREYTVLLDPPEYKQSVSAASDVVTVNKPVATQSVAPIAVQQKTTSSASSSKQVNRDASTSDKAEQLMTVKGDTLISIAKEMRIEGVSLDQMLVGLYQNNKEAFSNGNMNRLKVGQIIKAPSKEDLTAIGVQEAKKTIKAHASNWNAYRNALADTVKVAPATDESEPKQSTSGKISSAEDQAAAIKSGPKDVVKLSAGDKNLSDTKVDQGTGADVNAKLIALQEEATAREKALKEAQEKTAALEKQIEDMQKLLALKNQTMTELQKNAQSVDKPADAATEKPVEPVKQAPVKAPPPVVAQSEPEPSFIESVFEGTDIAVIGGSSALALLGVGWLFLRNKRRKDLDSFERGILTSGGLRANTVFGNTTGNSSTSDTSFLTDFAQSADGSMIDTNDVDPIAEAEVYMAYGRDAQAEEILKDAITKEPKRYELHLKLLEMYAGRKDISAFEAIAGELYTTLGAEDPTWAKVAEMGALLEPENPLYDLANAAPAGLTNQKEKQTLDVSDFADVSVVEDAGLDFSLDEELAVEQSGQEQDASSVVMESFSAAQPVEHELEFDLGSLESASTLENLSEDLNQDSSVQAESGDEVVTESVDLLQDEENTSNSNDHLMEFTLDADVNDSVDTSHEEMQSGSIDTEAPSFADTAPVLDFSIAMDDEAAAIEIQEEDAAKLSHDFNLSESSDNNSEITLSSASSPEDSSFETTEIESADEEYSIDDSSQSNTVTEEITFDLPADLEEPAPVLEKAESIGQPEANAFDFSSISLDLGDDAQALADESVEDLSVDMSAPAVSENQDVDIKLDLVAAYIDMDDKEGARELLDEVIKEGGPQQRLRAEQLLAGLV